MKKILSLLFILSASLASAQVTATIPSPQVQCDINNPGDMIEVFNLRDSEAEIITGQTDVVVTYHLTSGDALGNGGFIATPEMYENLPPAQIIFVRVENINNANDWQITTMEISVSQPPVPLTTDPEPLVQPDTSGDGFAVFDITEIASQLYSDVFAQEITYYLTQEDAETVSNPIAVPTEFLNTVNPQEVYARAQNAPEHECVVITPFQLVVDQNLTVQQERQASLNIYPNPAVDFITVEGRTAFSRVSIFSSTGQRVKTLEHTPNTKLTIAVDTFKTGIYFVQIDTKTTFTFIKK